jgi:carbon-monoxide dehydrogenase large subunit
MTRYAISQGVTQVEAYRLITGQGRFTDDIILPRQCHAVFLRSPYAHADIKKIDVRAANQMPGILAALTGDDWEADGLSDVPGLATPKRRGGVPGYRPPRPPLSRGKVRHVGQIIAVVIAESINQAKDAIEAIEVDFEPLDAMVDQTRALEPGAPRIWPDCENNEAFFVERGDAAKADAAITSRSMPASNGPLLGAPC